MREVRGRIVKELTGGDASYADLHHRIVGDDRFDPALRGLMSDGLVTETNGVLHLTK